MERTKRSTFTVRCVLLTLVLWHCRSECVRAQATNVERQVLATPAEAAEATRGFKFGGSAGVFFRSPDDRVGFSFEGDLLYAFRLGPLVLAPGARIAGYFAKDFDAVGAFGTLSPGLALGPVLPFLIGGLGIGYIGDPKDVGIAYLGGGGLLVALRRRLLLGAEATYQGFALTDFHALYLGAILRISY
jgi:hypothetical protein